MKLSDQGIYFHKVCRRIILLLLFPITCIHSELFSQQVSKSEDLFVTAFTNENGLRQSMVSQVCQDERGLIWMVTGDGLHYFDGQDFMAFRVPYTKVFNQTDNVMRNLAESGPGHFILSSNSSLLEFNSANGQFKIVYRKEGDYPMVFNTFMDQMPLAWIRGLSFFLVKGEKLIPLKLILENSAGLPPDFVPSQVFRSGPDELLVCGRNGIIAMQLGNRISDSVYNAKWIPLADCRAVAKTSQGQVVLLAGSKLFRWQNDQEQVLIMDTGLGGKLNLFIDNNDNTWLIDQSFNKIYRIDEGKLTEINLFKQNGVNAELFTPSVISIFEDREHNLWFGTDGDGVLLYSPARVHFQKSNIGFTRCVTGFNHKIWAGTFNNGLWELSPDLSTAKRVNPAYFDNRKYFLDFTADKSGRLWIASRTGLDVVDSKGISTFRYPVQCLQAKFINQGGDSILLVCDNQLIRFKALEKPVCYKTGKYVSFREFLSVGDYFWVGTAYGLYRYGKKLGFDAENVFNKDMNKLSAIPVYDLLFHDGFIWVASCNGIQCYYTDGRARPLPECFRSLKNDVIYSIMPDARGRLWITGNNGISCISAKDNRVILFNLKNNLQSPEFNFNATCINTGGDLYFGGIRGLNQINPNTFNPDKQSPVVQLISLSVSDTAYSRCIPPANPVINLSRLSPHISGKVFSTDYFNAGFLLYSYFLEGYQEGWSKPTLDAVFTYRNLPPGKYRLFVKCADTYMNWSKPVLLLTVSITPPVYSRWWFLAVVALCIISITILIVKKIQQIRFQNQIKEMERQYAIEKERHRISKDMHDEVGASLTRISILSELAKNQHNESAKMQQIIGQISEISGGVVDEMSEIIWAMNPRNDTLDSFTSYNRQYASSYLESAGIEGSFSFPDDIPARPMSSELRRNLFLTVKEALHNVVKHSGASQVHMQLYFGEQVLQIIISDNGKGFLIEKTHDWGNGLINMRRRIEEPGGRFEIMSEEGKGTTIDMSVKFPLNDKSH